MTAASWLSTTGFSWNICSHYYSYSAGGKKPTSGCENHPSYEGRKKVSLLDVWEVATELTWAYLRKFYRLPLIFFTQIPSDEVHRDWRCRLGTHYLIKEWGWSTTTFLLVSKQSMNTNKVGPTPFYLYLWWRHRHRSEKLCLICIFCNNKDIDMQTL